MKRGNILMNTSDLRVKKTLRALRETMLELIQKKPIEKISVIDICEAAMVNRATFYAHFEDKYRLLDYCIEQFFNPFETTEQKHNTPSEYSEDLVNIVHEILVHLEQNKGIYKAILQRNSSIEVLMRSNVENQLLEIGKKYEDIGMKPPVPPDMLAAFLSGAIVNLVIHWINQENAVSADKITQYLETLVTESFMPTQA